MKICVNTLSVHDRTGGVKTYLLHLLDAMLDGRRDVEIVLFCGHHNVELFEPLAARYPHATIELLPLRGRSRIGRILFDQLWIPRAMGRHPGAVLLTPSNVASLLTGSRQIVVVQAPLAVPRIRHEVPTSSQTLTRLQRLYFDALMGPGLRRATRVVAVSAYLRDRLVASYPEVESKVTVIYEGVDAGTFGSAATGESARAEAAAPPYLLMVNTLFPYKNVARAIEALAQVRRQEPELAAVRLVVAGKDPDGLQRAALERVAERAGVGDAVEFLGLVPHERVAELYARAAAFVFPSLMETFGLPILEAMGAGVAVVASDRASIPEVVGDAGLVVDPDAPGALERALIEILTKPQLRSELRERGERRAAEFTWRRSAADMIQLAEALAPAAREGRGVSTGGSGAR